MTKVKIHLVHLYSAEMNIYGDTGNRIILEQRLHRRGYVPVVHFVGVGDRLPENVHLILGGGGQDKGQELVSRDLQEKASQLVELRDKGVPMLMICGMYQLLGAFFRTQDGIEVPGAAVIDAYTIASGKRLVGNVIAESSEFGRLVGYENHSGRTYLGAAAQALATVKRGGGNNGSDNQEGLRQANIIGTYLHGPVLSKSPRVADWLLERSLEVAGYEGQQLAALHDLDKLAMSAAISAQRRPR